MKTPKKNVRTAKSSLVHRCSQLEQLVDVVYIHEPTDGDVLKKASTTLNEMSKLVDSSTINFL